MDPAYDATETAIEPLGTRAPASRGAVEPRPVQPGDVLGRYAVRALLGAGGIGRVFEAVDTRLGRTVALKLVDRPRFGASQTRTRLVREADALARVSHPNVVTVLDAGEHEEWIYLAMELVEGGTLAGWLRERRRGWREVRDAFVAAGRGLEAAHAAGIVHRDFKPQNVIVGPERVVVLDFGLARAENDSEDDPLEAPRSLSVSVTLTGELVGTPRYMAPEQLAGRLATARSDQFSFCVALFEALHGRPPFDGDSIAELRRAAEQGAASLSVDDAPAFLARAVARGLEPEPERRHASMSALLAEMAGG